MRWIICRETHHFRCIRKPLSHWATTAYICRFQQTQLNHCKLNMKLHAILYISYNEDMHVWHILVLFDYNPRLFQLIARAAQSRVQLRKLMDARSASNTISWCCSNYSLLPTDTLMDVRLSQTHFDDNNPTTIVKWLEKNVDHYVHQ